MSLERSLNPDILALFDMEPDQRTPLPKVFIPDNYSPEIIPSPPDGIVASIDKQRAYPILDTLLDAYTKNQPPYNQDRARLPHDPRHMPKTLTLGTREHAVFLFNVCYYMRGGIKSNDAVKRMSNMYDAEPKLFVCEDARLYDSDTLQAIIKEHGLGFQKTVAEQWIENAKRLADSYDGDPRKIFDGVDTYEESQRLIQNKNGDGFVGFQEKMTSMIIYYLMDEELIQPFNFPIPVDIHVMRVSIANKMINFADTDGNSIPYGTNIFNKATLSKLRELYFDYANDRQVNPLRLCDAVWMLSESSCGRNPGNVTLEPLGREHRDGRNTYLIPKPVDIKNAAQQKAYAESCGVCPIEGTCELNIPGKQYYVAGSTIIRGRRIRFPISADMQEKTLF